MLHVTTVTKWPQIYSVDKQGSSASRNEMYDRMAGKVYDHEKSMIVDHVMNMFMSKNIRSWLKVKDLNWKYATICGKYTIIHRKYTIFYFKVYTILGNLDTFILMITYIKWSYRLWVLGSSIFSHDRILHVGPERSRSVRLSLVSLHVTRDIKFWNTPF